MYIIYFQVREIIPEAEPLVTESTKSEPPKLPRKPSLETHHTQPPPPAEADLLNLGIPNNEPVSSSTAPTPTANPPGLNIFDSDSGQAAASSAGDDDLFGGFGAFTQAVPPTTPVVSEPVINDLFGKTNGKPADIGDLLFGQSESQQQSAPRPTPTAEHTMFDPFGTAVKDNLFGKTGILYS